MGRKDLFDSGGRQVGSDVWRSTNEMIKAAGSIEMRDYFRTHDVAAWMYSTKARDDYAEIYGADKLLLVDQFGVCEENIHADQVAGTIQGTFDDATVVVGNVRKAYTGPPATVESVSASVTDLETRVSALESKVG